MITSFKENNTAILILNRPLKSNALHPDLISQLKKELDKIKDEENIYSIIITGQGNSFCAGADLEYLKKLQTNSDLENYEDSKNISELFKTIYSFSKPVIAAVNGPAIAGGCGLASVCDLIIANPEKSKFGYSEVKIGFLPAIVSIFLINRIGYGNANALLLTGEIIDGKRAFELGFVNYLAENPLEYAKLVAQKLNRNSLYSLIESKKMLKQIINLNIDDAIDYCLSLNTISRRNKDFIKGLEKFLNKNK